jgi:hypothetical protein
MPAFTARRPPDVQQQTNSDFAGTRLSATGKTGSWSKRGRTSQSKMKKCWMGPDNTDDVQQRRGKKEAHRYMATAWKKNDRKRQHPFYHPAQNNIRAIPAL